MTEPRFPDAPLRIQQLPLDHRGFPVPYFVAWIDGKPDHRIADADKFIEAVQKKRCWICGQGLSREPYAFLLGPMCVITRTVSEPPSHRECAEFSARACPFLSIPPKGRRDDHLPAAIKEPAGISLKRNPGVIALWLCDTYRITPQDDGMLFSVGQPREVFWYCEGRSATRTEVKLSINTGLPFLIDLAKQEGTQALRDLRERMEAMRLLLPTV
jgi:hypothetical protein